MFLPLQLFLDCLVEITLSQHLINCNSSLQYTFNINAKVIEKWNCGLGKTFNKDKVKLKVK